MRLDSDDFELFGLERRFQLERSALDARWRTLQAEVHPDRFAAQGASAQRVALQWAVRVNEAYQRLKDPLRRAAYLCELAGHPIDAENNTAMPSAFLMRQIQQIEALAAEVAAEREMALRCLQVQLDSQLDRGAASQQVRALMFIERFAGDIDRRLEALEQ